MLSFSSWALIGSLAGSLSNQGINILLNIFFGPAVNAARGLAMTFNNYVYSFVANFYNCCKSTDSKNLCIK